MLTPRCVHLGRCPPGCRAQWEPLTGRPLFPGSCSVPGTGDTGRSSPRGGGPSPAQGSAPQWPPQLPVRTGPGDPGAGALTCTARGARRERPPRPVPSPCPQAGGSPVLCPPTYPREPQEGGCARRALGSGACAAGIAPAAARRQRTQPPARSPPPASPRGPGRPPLPSSPVRVRSPRVTPDSDPGTGAPRPPSPRGALSAGRIGGR